VAKGDPQKIEPQEKDTKAPPAKIEPVTSTKQDDPPKQPPEKQPPEKAPPERQPALAKSVTNSVGMPLVLIPAGKFTMGSPSTDDQRGPHEAEHDVELARPFYLSAHEVTQKQFQEVLARNPSHFSATGGGRQRLAGADPSNWPVESVAYADAVEFCERLTARPDEKSAGRVYRLPTEAEWEYACRAGTTSRFFTGDVLLPRAARCDFGPAGGVPQPKTPAAVGSLSANEWGLFDMHGNVAEWCLDWHSEAPAGGVDPRGPQQGTQRVIRGGGFYDSPARARSADRFRAPPATTDMAIGFRVLCETPVSAP
jgi:formylglycine-generating enzyme required for sulfatase activity